MDAVVEYVQEEYLRIEPVITGYGIKYSLDAAWYTSDGQYVEFCSSYHNVYYASVDAAIKTYEYEKEKSEHVEHLAKRW